MVLIPNNTPDKQSLGASGVNQVCFQCPDVYKKVLGAFQSSQPLAKDNYKQCSIFVVELGPQK